MNLNESMLDGERLHGDPADCAQHYEEAERAAGIYAATHPAQEMPVLHDGERVCLGCADPISPARAGAYPMAVRCRECQDLEDRKKKRHLA